MGMSTGGSAKQNYGRGRGRTSPRPIADINITPMVDVMLVLLIVFMVAAPLMAMGVPVDLPKTAAQTLPMQKKPITVTVEPSGTISVDGDVIALDTLVATITALASEGTSERIYVRGDATTAYGTIMEVMGELSGAGYAQIGLITERKEN